MFILPVEFFKAMLTAIKNEEIELNNLFVINNTIYEKNHQGVCNLYETTFVYLIFKELLKRQFPYKVIWECPYPGNKKEHCDIGLENGVTGELEALIEFKLWIKEDDNAIKSDIRKLQEVNVSNCNRYIVVIGYGGDLKDNDQYLTDNNKALTRINMDSLKTKYYKVKPDLIEDNDLNILMYQVK